MATWKLLKTGAIIRFPDGVEPTTPVVSQEPAMYKDALKVLNNRKTYMIADVPKAPRKFKPLFQDYGRYN